MSITGKVRWFKNDRAYGFLTDDSGQDYFVHAKDLRKAGLQTLEQGQHVATYIRIQRTVEQRRPTSNYWSNKR